MSHEIEADFKNDWPDEDKQCRRCTSFIPGNGMGFCSEAGGEVPYNGHCDFFQSVD